MTVPTGSFAASLAVCEHHTLGTLTTVRVEWEGESEALACCLHSHEVFFLSPPASQIQDRWAGAPSNPSVPEAGGTQLSSGEINEKRPLPQGGGTGKATQTSCSGWNPSLGELKLSVRNCQVWWPTPVIPAVQEAEAEAGRSL